MDKNLFIEDYMKPLNDKLAAENKKTYIAGDFNFDLSDIANKESFNFYETMMSSFQLPVFTLPTKINPKKHIDNIFTNQRHPDMKSGNLSISISDHLPSFFSIPKDNQNHIPKKQNMYTRNTKNFDRLNFILDYFDVDWDAILQANKDDVNLSMQIFMNKVNGLLDKYMPLRKLTQRI